MKYISETYSAEKEAFGPMEQKGRKILTKEEQENFWKEIKYSDTKLVSER